MEEFIEPVTTESTPASEPVETSSLPTTGPSLDEIVQQEPLLTEAQRLESVANRAVQYDYALEFVKSKCSEMQLRDALAAVANCHDLCLDVMKRVRDSDDELMPIKQLLPGYKNGVALLLIRMATLLYIVVQNQLATEDEIVDHLQKKIPYLDIDLMLSMIKESDEEPEFLGFMALPTFIVNDANELVKTDCDPERFRLIRSSELYAQGHPEFNVHKWHRDRGHPCGGCDVAIGDHDLDTDDDTGNVCIGMSHANDITTGNAYCATTIPESS